MYNISLKLNGNKINFINLSLADNLETYSRLNFTTQTKLEIKQNISNKIILEINGKLKFTGFILTCSYTPTESSFECVPLAYLAEITHMPALALNPNLEMDTSPKTVIATALRYPSSVFSKPIQKLRDLIVEYEVKEIGQENVKVDLFSMHNETPASLINSLLAERNVFLTNNVEGKLIIGQIQSIYDNPQTHEVNSYISFETSYNLELNKSAIAVNMPVIVLNRFGGSDQIIRDDSFLNIEMKQVPTTTYPMKSVLHNVHTKNLYNSTVTVLETLQDFNVGDFIKNKDFNTTMDTFLISGKQINLSSNNISLQYTLRHKDGLSVL